MKIRLFLIVCIIIASTMHLFSCNDGNICPDESTENKNQDYTQNENNNKKTFSEGLDFVSFGDGTCGVNGIGTCMDIDIIIPSVSPEGDVVTSINNGAFLGCSNIKSIRLPDKLHKLGFGSFKHCTSLTSITVDENNNWLKSIDGNLYNIHGTDLILYATGKKDTSFVIPDSVIGIVPFAFDSCYNLTYVEIPDSVIYVDMYAFAECKNLSTVKMGSNVSIIGEGAFLGCKSLKNITIPDSVTDIGNGAFESCQNLTNINIPNKVSSIGGNVFRNCISLMSISMPNSIKTIGDYAFYGCNSLKSIIIPDGVTSIGIYAFYNCKNLESIIIPDSVMSIGSYAFYYCSSLSNVYYTGTEEKWKEITIVANNHKLKEANIHYNYASQ